MFSPLFAAKLSVLIPLIASIGLITPKLASAGTLVQGQTLTFSRSDVSSLSARKSWTIDAPVQAADTRAWSTTASLVLGGGSSSQARIGGTGIGSTSESAVWKIQVPANFKVKLLRWGGGTVQYGGSAASDDTVAWQYSTDGNSWTDLMTPMVANTTALQTISHGVYEVALPSPGSSVVYVRLRKQEGNNVGDNTDLYVYSNYGSDGTAGGENGAAYVEIDVVPTDILAGPYTIDNLGSPLSSATLAQKYMWKSANNHTHIIAYYTSNFNVFQYYHIDLTTGSKRMTNMSATGTPGYATTALVNDKLYVTTSAPAKLFEYDFNNWSQRWIANLARPNTQYTVVGDDGCLYIGESGVAGGGVERYNPATDQVQNLGVMDPAFTGFQYAYTIGADQRYVYVGLGQIPWYLAIHDRQTGTTTLKWKADNDTLGYIYRGQNGGWFYNRVNPVLGINKTYQLVNGDAVDVTPVPPLEPWYKRAGVVTEPAYFEPVYGYQINLDDAYPYNSNSASSTIKWRTSGSGTWQQRTQAGLNVVPVTLNQIYSWNEDSLLGVSFAYGPIFTYETSTATTSVSGRTPYSLYDVLLPQSISDVFLSGYTAATLRHDPTQAWTMTASVTNLNDIALNPHNFVISGSGVAGKYHYFLAEGADSRVYVGIHHERNSVGGALGWYNPSDRSTNGLRTPFLLEDVTDLKAVEGGSKILYSSININSSGSQGTNPGKIFVFDTVTQTITHTFNCPTGQVTAGKLAEAEPGKIIGVTTDRMYKMNTTTGSVDYNIALGGTFQSGLQHFNQRLVKGPDGYLWFFIGNGLHRVNPANGSKQLILTTTPSNFIFHGANLYFYGGTELKAVRNIF